MGRRGVSDPRNLHCLFPPTHVTCFPSDPVLFVAPTVHGQLVALVPCETTRKQHLLLRTATDRPSSDAMSRRRPNFRTRTAEEDVARLDPSDSGPTNLFRGIAQWWGKRDHNTEAEDSSGERVFPAGALHESSTHKDHKHGHRFRSTDQPKKLGTLSGVFVPTTLNVLSILMFLRFGFILGQAGVLGILGRQIG